MNSEKFKAFEKEKKALKKMKTATHSPNYRHSPSKSGQLSNIKGLKEFLAKDTRRSMTDT